MPVCSTGKEGQGALSIGPLDQLSAAEAGSTPEKPLHQDFQEAIAQQTPTSLFDDDEEMDGQEESEQGSPFVGSECSADLDGDQLSVLLPTQESLDALLLCSSLFSSNVSNSTVGVDDGLFDQRPATVDAELFDSFLDLDWSAIEQSAGGAAVTGNGPIVYPQTATTTLLESSV